MPVQQTTHAPTTLARSPVRPRRVLRIDASARRTGSISRRLTDAFIARLCRSPERSPAGHGEPAPVVVSRDLGLGLPFVDEAWVAANLTSIDERSAAQQSALAQSDALVGELQTADIIVIGMPIYNFGIPAVLKAWVDMVARARLTFRYTERGAEGLLRGKRAYLLVASGGTAVGSDIDFASTYLRHMFGFLGITEVEVIGAQGAEAVDDALARIERAVAALHHDS